MITYYNERTYKIFGSSTDIKPTLANSSNGSIFQETDTGDSYIYSAENNTWKKISSSSGGSSTAGITDINIEADMIATLTADNNSKYYKFTGVTTTKFTNGYIYQVDNTNSCWNVFSSNGTVSLKTFIQFTIDGSTHQAEEGMTWADWVASDYNTEGYIIYDISGSNYICNSLGTYAVAKGSNQVATTDIIISGTAYSLAMIGGVMN